MKANELMIGDWVMVNDVEHTHPLQVAEIFKKCGAYYATLYWDGMPDNVNPETLTADIDKVLPIPLTPEILEKNGVFKHKFEGHLEECYSTSANPISNEQFILWKETDRFELVLRHIVDNLTYSALRCKVRYVHELQHALRVCGIDKEIIL